MNVNACSLLQDSKLWRTPAHYLRCVENIVIPFASQSVLLFVSSDHTGFPRIKPMYTGQCECSSISARACR